MLMAEKEQLHFNFEVPPPGDDADSPKKVSKEHVDEPGPYDHLVPEDQRTCGHPPGSGVCYVCEPSRKDIYKNRNNRKQ